MIPILRFSEPFFYFLSACVAAVVCVVEVLTEAAAAYVERDL